MNSVRDLINDKKLASVLSGMIERCKNPKLSIYHYYGGRGITVCEEWKKDKNSFLDWSYNNGYKPGLSIDRIDVNGHYDPNNCRWATSKEQQRNKRNSCKFEYQGKQYTPISFYEEFGVPNSFFSKKFNTGLSPSEILVPYTKRRQRKTIPTKAQILNLTKI